MFILDRGTPAGPAKAVCERCPVYQECDDYASGANVIGVWGKRVHTYNKAKDVSPAEVDQDARPRPV